MNHTLFRRASLVLVKYDRFQIQARLSTKLIHPKDNLSVLHGILCGQSRIQGELLTDRTVVTRFTDWDWIQGPKSKSLNILERAIASKRLIGLVITRNHEDLEVNLPASEKYALAGQWLVTDYWIQRRESTDGNDITDKKGLLVVRIDRYDATGPAWWKTNSELSTPEPLQSTRPRYATCGHCKKNSPIRFKGMPYCGHIDCKSRIGVRKHTGYDMDYLNWRPYMAGVVIPQYLDDEPPDLRTAQKFKEVAKTTTRAGKPRIICPTCNSMNQKDWFTKYICRRCGCIKPYAPPPLHLEDMMDMKYLNLPPGAGIPGVKERVQVHERETRSSDGYTIQQWDLAPGTLEASLIVAAPSRQTVYSSGGPKELFEKVYPLIRSGSVPLSRFEFKSRIQGTVTRWYGINMGKRYEIANMDMSATEIPSGQEPPEFLGARDLITSAAKSLSGQEDPAFNEILCLGYLGEGGMGWHSDNEKGVKGLVASVSYGATCTLSFGIKPDYYFGKTRTGKILGEEDPVLPGCAKEAQRRALRAQLSNESITEAAYLTRLQAILADLKYSKETKWLLQVPLPGNGGIMVQVGEDLNRYYNHKTDCLGPMRMVLTCRRIEAVETPSKTKAMPKSAAKAQGGAVGSAEKGRGEESGGSTAAKRGSADSEQVQKPSKRMRTSRPRS